HCLRALMILSNDRILLHCMSPEVAQSGGLRLIADGRFRSEADMRGGVVSTATIANDPHRKSTRRFCCNARVGLLYLARDLWRWGTSHEASRIHHATRRRGGCMAARGACATARDAGNRVSRVQIA